MPRNRAISLLFEREEKFIIPPHTRQVIYARVQNKEEKLGLAPLQELEPKLLFGNFVAENISDEPVRIKASSCHVKTLRSDAR